MTKSSEQRSFVNTGLAALFTLILSLFNLFSLSPPSFCRQVLETCVKNCGHRFHVQVASRDFMDGVLVRIISPKNNPPTIVQDKVLSLIQVFGYIFLNWTVFFTDWATLLCRADSYSCCQRRYVVELFVRLSHCYECKVSGTAWA